MNRYLFIFLILLVSASAQSNDNINFPDQAHKAKGSGRLISGTPDSRWNNDFLREIKQLKGSDFESNDISSFLFKHFIGFGIPL